MFRLTAPLLCMALAVSPAEGELSTTRPAKAEPSGRAVQVSDAGELLAAVAKLAKEGGTITLLPGTYTLTEPIIVKGLSNVVFVGSGWNTILRRQGEGDAIVFDGNCWSCWVRDLRIEGDPKAKAGSGIAFRNGAWSGICVVDRCHLTGFAESGIRFEGSDKTPFSSNTVSNCWLTNNLGDQLYSRANNDFYITGNQFGAGGDKAPRSGVLLDHSSAGTYTMNYHWGNVVALRLGPGAHYNRIENNRFEQSRESGLVIGDSRGGDSCNFNIITGNTIHTNSEHNSGKFPAVIAYDASDVTFCQNQIFSWNSEAVRHTDGLVLGRGCRNWIVKDNIFRHHTGKAIVSEEKAEHVVKDNLGQ
jgi:hypothetical protein